MAYPTHRSVAAAVAIASQVRLPLARGHRGLGTIKAARFAKERSATTSVLRALKAPPAPDVAPAAEPRAAPPHRRPSQPTLAALIGLASGALGLVFDAFPTWRPDPRTSAQ